MANVQKHTNVTRLVMAAMLSAVAVVLQYLEIAIPIMPSFIKLDFSDIPELIGAFVAGPVWGVAICLVKNLIHMLVSQSAGVGELSNFILAAAFAFTAGLIYRHRKTKRVALAAGIVGALAMAAVSIPSNYYLIYPIYAEAFGGMDKIVGAYTLLLPAADTLMKALLIFNLPFTLVKGLICVGVTMVIYKPLSNTFARMSAAIQKGN